MKTIEELQYEIDGCLVELEHLLPLFDEDVGEMIECYQNLIKENELQISILKGETTQAQIIALTDKNTVSLFT